MSSERRAVVNATNQGEVTTADMYSRIGTMTEEGYSQPPDFFPRVAKPDCTLTETGWPTIVEDGVVKVTLGPLPNTAAYRFRRSLTPLDHLHFSFVDCASVAGAASIMYKSRGVALDPYESIKSQMRGAIGGAFNACCRGRTDRAGKPIMDDQGKTVVDPLNISIIKAATSLGLSIYDEDEKCFVIPCAESGSDYNVIKLYPTEEAIELTKHDKLFWSDDNTGITPSPQDTTSFFHTFTGEKVTSPMVDPPHMDGDDYMYSFNVPKEMSKPDLGSFIGAFSFVQDGDFPKGQKIIEKLEHTYNTCSNSSRELLDAFAAHAEASVKREYAQFEYNPRTAKYAQAQTRGGTTRGASMNPTLTIKFDFPEAESNDGQDDFVVVVADE